MPLILTLDAALATCSAGLVADRVLLASSADRDSAALPAMTRRLLAAHPPPALIAVTIGPGSFTGLRAAIALAHGIGIGLGVPVVGVTLGAALAGASPGGRQLWTVIDTKRGTVFLERDGAIVSLALADLPSPAGAVAVAGDAAVAVASRLAARGADVQLLDDRAASPLGIAFAALAGLTRPPLPVYVDPPHARPGPPGRPPPQ